MAFQPEEQQPTDTRRLSPLPLLLAAMLTLSPFPLCAGTDTATLSVHATGFTHEHGHAVAKLYAPGDDVLGPGRWVSKADIHEGAATLQWHDLPLGRYAVVVFHDENDNGTIDHRMRMPAEPLGFSNGFALSLFSGMPSFEKLQFELHQADQVIEVKVH